MHFLIIYQTVYEAFSPLLKFTIF